MNRMIAVDVSVRLIFHAVLVGSIYLLFAGHNQPGGGFAGGLVAGAAIALRYVAGGIEEVRGLTRFKPWTILGAGLLIDTLTAAIPLVLGEPVLDAGDLSLDIDGLGTVKATSGLPFDIGVYLVVVGLVLMVFEAFGDDHAVPADQEAP